MKTYHIYLWGVLLILILILSGCSEDDNPSNKSNLPITFQKTFDREFYDVGRDILELENGDFILAGNILSESDLKFSANIIKTDNSGNELWSKIYTNEEGCYCNEIVEINDGFVFGGGKHLTKIDTSGNEIWRYAYWQDLLLYSNSVLSKTSDNHLLFAGAFEGSNADSCQIMLMKLDFDGNLINQISINAKVFYHLSVCESVTNGYILSYCYEFPDSRTTICKVDEEGQVAWSAYYGTGTDWPYVFDICPTSDGGYVITGEAEFNGSHVFLMKVDDDGNEQWCREYHQEAEGFDVEETSDGGFIITGEVNSCSLLLLKTDGSGNQLWYVYHNVQNYECLGSRVIETFDGGFAAIGKAAKFISGSYDNDILFIKTDPNGIVY